MKQVADNRKKKSVIWKIFFWVPLAMGAAVLILGLLMLPPHWASRKKSNEAAAVETLRELYTALIRYRSRYEETGFPDSLIRMTSKLAPPSCWNAGLLPEEMGQDRFTRDGYDFHYELTAGSGSCPPGRNSSPGQDFELRASPSVSGRTGVHSFYLDASGKIRQGQPGSREGIVVESLDPVVAAEEPESGILLKDVIILRNRAFHVPPVAFNHRLHVEELLIDCETCHHPPRPGRTAEGAFQPCSTCHEPSVRLPMKTTYKRAFHDAMAGSGTCIDCHKQENAKGRAAPVDCAGCHIKPVWFGQPFAAIDEEVNSEEE